MKSKTVKLVKVHFLRLMKGEDLLESIIKYCKEKNISSGSIQGIGAISNPSIGYYDLENKTYLTNNYDFNAELVNCSGNIATNKDTGEIIAHLHMVVGDPKGQTYGGHVMPKNRISVTGEFIILETEGSNYRAIDEDFNLMLLDL
ncbi:MAG: PPC domain-containing DNA-binding protein [Candidatus Heimdallarchaeaceae archaeon]